MGVSYSITVSLMSAPFNLLTHHENDDISEKTKESMQGHPGQPSKIQRS